MKAGKVTVVGNWRMYGEDWKLYKNVVFYINDGCPDTCRYSILITSGVNTDYVYQCVDYYNSGAINNGLDYDLVVKVDEP